MAITPTNVFDVFQECVNAINNNVLIQRSHSSDKEFHFQNWFKNRVEAIKVKYDSPGRNTYPDFSLVSIPEGYEVKGLAYPGREASYDCNSQVPSGLHNGRTIFYVFGRYPKTPTDLTKYEVLDLVICHGDFLNADHKYEHKNKSIKCFGSYGDIMIRDRKMYVAKTPYSIADGLSGEKTLILPENFIPDKTKFVQAGRIVRKEASQLVVGYSFDLQKNEITPEFIKNPTSGIEHIFIAYRMKAENIKKVVQRESIEEITDEENPDEEDFLPEE